MMMYLCVRACVCVPSLSSCVQAYSLSLPSCVTRAEALAMVPAAALGVASVVLAFALDAPTVVVAVPAVVVAAPTVAVAVPAVVAAVFVDVLAVVVVGVPVVVVAVLVVVIAVAAVVDPVLVVIVVAPAVVIAVFVVVGQGGDDAGSVVSPRLHVAALHIARRTIGSTSCGRGGLDASMSAWRYT